MPNIASAKMQNPPAIPSFLAFSTPKITHSIPRRPSLKKARLPVYLDPDLMRSLADYAARRDQSRSLVAEAAVASFLSPDADERREAQPRSVSTASTDACNGSNVISSSQSR